MSLSLRKYSQEQDTHKFRIAVYVSWTVHEWLYEHFDAHHEMNALTLDFNGAIERLHVKPRPDKPTMGWRHTFNSLEDRDAVYDRIVEILMKYRLQDVRLIKTRVRPDGLEILEWDQQPYIPKEYSPEIDTDMLDDEPHESE